MNQSDPASGNSADWAYEDKNITLAYSFEFRPRGPRGNILEPDNRFLLILLYH